MAVGDASVGLDRSFDHILNCWRNFAGVLSSLKQSEGSEDGVPITTVIETAFVGNSSVEVHLFNEGQGFVNVLFEESYILVPCFVISQRVVFEGEEV